VPESGRIGMMHFGKLLEIGATEAIFAHPTHDYTRALLATRRDDPGEPA
jgi:oligopeptide transport system ATP-binding protein